MEISDRIAPSTLLEAGRYFTDADVATQHAAAVRWPDGPECPRCYTIDENHYYLKTRRMWKCRECMKQFSVKTGTVFEDSAIGIDKWLLAIWMIANPKDGTSTLDMVRCLGVTQKTAWFMKQRIEFASLVGAEEGFDKVSEYMVWNAIDQIYRECGGEHTIFTADNLAYIIASKLGAPTEEIKEAINYYKTKIVKAGGLIEWEAADAKEWYTWPVYHVVS